MTTISVSNAGVLINEVNKSTSSLITQTVGSDVSKIAVTTPSTIVSLNTEKPSDSVYTKSAMFSENRQAWANPIQDDISSIMARNSSRGRAEGLAAQWRGLGSALLGQFAATGASYRQTLVNYDASGMKASSTKELDEAALSSFSGTTAKVSLTVQTRSGKKVEISIAVDRGQTLGRNGLQVEVKASGSLTDTERQELGKLAQGFDKVLEGLGRPNQPKIDVSGLAAFDRTVLQSVDLSVRDPQEGQPLSSFNLHLGADRKTIAFKGLLGELNLEVDAAMPLGQSSTQLQQSSIAELLSKFDAAKERSHADERLVELFKDSFSQLHAVPGGVTAIAPAVADAGSIQPLLSGLADFKASFSSEFERTGRFGSIVEMGKAYYEVNQDTSLKQDTQANQLTAIQTFSESLSANYTKSRGGVMLDTGAGNFDAYTVSDSTVTTTTASAIEGRLNSAQRKTEQNLLQTMKKLVNFKVEEQRDTPLNQTYFENLIHP